MAGDVYHKGYTIMRALIMDFPEDVNVRNIDNQYMFGPSLMVCPVYEYKAIKRTVYLPANNDWYDFYTGEFYTGGQNIEISVSYDKIPLFVKAGSIIPIGPEIEYTSQKSSPDLTLLVYEGNNCQFKLYEDEDVNYNYEKGSFSNITFSYDNFSKAITVGNLTGTFDNMVKERKINIVFHSAQKARKLELNPRPDNQIIFNGGASTINLKK